MTSLGTACIKIFPTPLASNAARRLLRLVTVYTNDCRVDLCTTRVTSAVLVKAKREIRPDVEHISQARPAASQL